MRILSFNKNEDETIRFEVLKTWTIDPL